MEATCVPLHRVKIAGVEVRSGGRPFQWNNFDLCAVTEALGSEELKIDFQYHS